MSSVLRRAFTIDYRSAAAFRVLLGIIILADLLTRAADLQAFYTDAGVLPRTELIRRFPYQASFSLLLISGHSAVISLLFAVAIGLAGTVIVGWRTRWTLPALWVMLISIQYRNPLINFGAEDFIRIMAFWAMFLPLDGAWSIRRVPPTERQSLSIAGLGALLQVGVIYLFAALLKTGPEWHSDYTAIYYALGQEPLQKPIGEWVRQLPMPLLQAMTAGIWWLELVGWLVLFSPIAHVPLRLLGIAAFAGMHLGFHLCLRVGLFPAIGAASMILFLPGVVWDHLLPTTVRPLATSPLGASAMVHRRRWRRPLPALLRGAWLHVLPACALAYVLLSNVRSLPHVKLAVPEPLAWLGWLRIDQGWSMFAPSPGKDFGWYVFPGTLRSGKDVDAYTFAEQPVRWQMPRPLTDWYVNIRWMQYLQSLWFSRDRTVYHAFARYLCRSWNDGYPREIQLERFAIHYILTVTPAPGEDDMPEDHTVLEWSCDTGVIAH